MMRDLRIGLIGYGHWGTNLARAAARTPGCRLVAISDLDPANRDRAAAAHPGIVPTPSADTTLADPQIDALVIATPASTHARLVSHALGAGKHVMVTKPLAPDANTAEALGRDAADRNLVLLVDHTFAFSPAVTSIGEILAAGRLGTLAYLESHRAGLGIFKDDVSVIEDLAIHDFAILDHFFATMPRRVSATWIRTHVGLAPSAAWITLTYADGFTAHVAAHWFAPAKRRSMVIAGAAGMLTWDDTATNDRVRIHDAGTDAASGVPAGRAPLTYRNRGSVIHPVAADEPLAIEMAHFRDAVSGVCAPRVDARAAARVARICMAASASASASGRPVELLA